MNKKKTDTFHSDNYVTITNHNFIVPEENWSRYWFSLIIKLI